MGFNVLHTKVKVLNKSIKYSYDLQNCNLKCCTYSFTSQDLQYTDFSNRLS